VRGALLSVSIGAVIACAVACTDQASVCTPSTEGGTTSGHDAGACPSLSLNASCECCVQASCTTEAAAALGPHWASLDFTGSPCADLLACYCGCGQDRNCVDACESPDAGHMSAVCKSALMELAACQTCKCGIACSSAVFDDGGVDATCAH